MAKRADNNDGSCREILTGKHIGKWRVQFRVVTEEQRKERIDKIFSTKSEAKEFLQTLRRGIRVEAGRRDRQLTLSEWFEWLAVNDWPETLASVTVAQRRSRFRRYVSRRLGNVCLSQLDAMQIRAFYRDLKAQGLSDSLLVSVKGDLVRAFNQAKVPYQRVPLSVANPFQLPLQQPRAREAIALTPQEVKRALSRPALTISQRAMLGVFLLGGLRLGEMMALTVQQLRMKDDLIAIDRAVRVEYGGKQTIGLPKKDKTRNAVMCKALKMLLLPHIQNLKPEDLLWPAASENKPRMKKLVYATWRTILRDAKLPKEMTPQDCRLTLINIIEKLMPSVSPTTLKDHVGHAASGVTEANYTRPLSSAQKILRNEIDRLLGPKQ